MRLTQIPSKNKGFPKTKDLKTRILEKLKSLYVPGIIKFAFFFFFLIHADNAINFLAREDPAILRDNNTLMALSAI